MNFQHLNAAKSAIAISSTIFSIIGSTIFKARPAGIKSSGAMSIANNVPGALADIAA